MFNLNHAQDNDASKNSTNTVEQQHGILKRQLEKIGLDANNLPKDLAQWQQFLQRINNSYFEAEHDRYRLERSMSVSSKEIIDLNSMLVHAQNIAAMGYWLYYKKTGIIHWSIDCVNILGSDFTSKVQTYHQFLDVMTPETREETRAQIIKVLKEGGKANIQTKIDNKWFDFTLVYNFKDHCVNGIDDMSNETITGIVMDITVRKEYELEVEKLNKQLIATARDVGRADISTSVLHNIGNVLNSVNASVGLLSEISNNDQYKMLNLACKKMQDHADNIGEYLSTDKKGQLIPKYITALSAEIEKKNQLIRQECTHLVDYINHIKSIIKSQQSWAKVSTVKNKVLISQLLEDSLRLTAISFENHNIDIINDCSYLGEIYCDESKLTQILVNLLANAKDAILQHYAQTKVFDHGEIIINTALNNSSNTLKISVTDNGIGMDEETLAKIFSFGFTNKVGGHGFGLHSSILSAQEMNGSLIACSPGDGKGATFTLTLSLDET